MTATIHDDRLACEKIRIEDEQHRRRHIGRRTHSSKRRRRSKTLRVLVTPFLRQQHCAGCDPPDTNLRSEHASEGSRELSLIHISEPTRLLSISYAVFCLKKK